MIDYNQVLQCLNCRGTDETCPYYFPTENDNKCAYYHAAQIDIEKVLSDDPHTTFPTDCIVKHIKKNNLDRRIK